MKKIVIVIGAPVVNMGSQAILKSLARNIKKVCPNSIISVFVTDSSFPKEGDIKDVDKYYFRYSFRNDRWSIYRLIHAIGRRLKISKKALNHIKMMRFVFHAKKADLVIIVGADNYDASYHSLWYMRETNQYADYIGEEKMILYNCSVSLADLSEDVIIDMAKFRYLTARDSISYYNMKKVMPTKNILFFPDVAFSLEAEKVEIPIGWEENNMIGVNLSSLITNGSYGITEHEVRAAYQRMLDYIIRETHLKICLIPHVKNNMDLSELVQLYEYIEDKNRVIFIDHENLNAAQTKFIISKCKLFVGARTHATIAAYSSMIPTLVVGYSIKSIGIAQDLLGTDKGYVVPVVELKDEYSLVKALNSIIQRYNEIRILLKKNVPSYINKSMEIQGLLSEIWGING